MTSPIRILFLHGYTQTGAVFRKKSGALLKATTKALSIPPENFHFPNGPIRLQPADMPGADPDALDAAADQDNHEYYGWWQHNRAVAPFTGIERSWTFLAEYLDAHGPFAGVVGFSQGAAMAAMLASALESGRARPEAFRACAHPPLRFAACYSGLRPGPEIEALKGLFEPKISTPMMNVIGSLDPVVEEAATMELVEACAEETGVVLRHPGGHYMPNGKAYIQAFVGFVQKAVEDGKEGEKEGGEEKEKEESVGDGA